MKITPADRYFSLCIRHAGNWTCARCGSVHEDGSMGLHCSHIYSRRHRNIRWTPENAVPHCFCCHSWYGGNPIESGVWAKEFLGSSALKILIEKKNTIVKISRAQEKEIAKHYRQEFERIKTLRDHGEEGVIQVIGWN